MIKVVSNEQMQSMDKKTIEKIGIPGVVLMENAGRGCAETIFEYMDENDLHGEIAVYCGKGNNGGDGYVVARYLWEAGFHVHVFSVGDPEKLSGDALTNYRVCTNLKIPVMQIKSETDLPSEEQPEVIVDALLGTGIRGAVTGLMAEVIEHINRQPGLVFAIDVPSGISGNSAAVNGAVVMADATITMALPKLGHLFFPARGYVGDLHVVPIGIPENIRHTATVKVNLVEPDDIELPWLPEDTHKYQSGKLFILAGSPGMTGAAYLSAAAALRTGIGLVNLGVPQSLNAILETKITEALTVPLADDALGNLTPEALAQIRDRCDWADAVIIGPGCGRSESTQKVLAEAISYCSEINRPLLLDADALYVLAQQPELQQVLTSNTVLTPHHGEFLRLKDMSRDQFESTPWQVLTEYCAVQKAIVNLKGAPSMTGQPDGKIFINSSGNEGLAKGGSGDVLSGLIGGLMARGMPAADAAVAGNYIHGAAADLLAENIGATSMLPGELLNYIAPVIKSVEEK
jgi:hydroxyethylthiazole kinase-like uncharacterized protein yjeF